MTEGWTGKRLRVDLTSGSIEAEKIDQIYQRKWLGGRGFNSEHLYREVGPEVDPLSPGNLLIFGTGPLTGTFAPACSKNHYNCQIPAGRRFW